MSIQQHDSTLLGAYVLGALDEQERREVDAHVAVCGECRLELEALKDLEAGLGEIPPEAFLDGPPDDGDLLLQRTLRQVRTERSRSELRRRVALSAVAVVAAAAVLGAGFLLGRTGSDSATGNEAVPQRIPTVATPPVEGIRVASVTDPGTGARMSVRVTPATDWVRVHAAVGGLPVGELCRLVVVGKDGTREVAGSWLVGSSEKGAGLDGSAAVAAEDVKEIVVENAAGKTFVTARLT
ncbi:zf-HC2 domain-containing protein [Streptomyces sp. NPDC000594]|uniref:anti-sigma factor family protein n=1 Tax=Streptomyces sp. NPDC000594 TaxID=3154261 RepID=UPI003327B5FB